MTPLERITERVNRLGDPDAVAFFRSLVSVVVFFDGNTCAGSIGCNLDPMPGPQRFHVVFLVFVARPDVRDIRVQVTAFDVPEWPFSDTVYIMTTASAEEVAGWFPVDVAPDETWVGFVEQAYERYTVPDGSRPVACWWD